MCYLIFHAQFDFVIQPDGGVKAGDVFLVPKPDNFPRIDNKVNVPVGKWKDGLFGCIDIGFCHLSNVFGCLCPEILLGQVMQRMRLSWVGGLVDNSIAVNTFWITVMLLVCYTIFDYALYTYLYYDLNQAPEYAITVQYIKYFGGFCFGIWFLLAKARARRNIRETYRIPEEQCVGCEDVVLSALCSCCTVTQMARHTGEYEKYPGTMGRTGLPLNAPILIV